MDFTDTNREVMAEFHANEGVVDEAAGGYFKGKPILLLHTNGAKTGASRVNPLIYLDEDGHRYVFASKGGAPESPDWYHNLVANPGVTVDVGTESYPATARVVTGAERDRIYAEQSRRLPQFGEYQEGTTRTIPVVELTPA